MSLAPILAASPATQIHIAAVTLAFAVGTWMLLRPKGTPSHRMLGRTFVALMLAAAISSFWIRGNADGSLSWLHLLAVYVTIAAPAGLLLARAGRTRGHVMTMVGLYIGALWIAGAFTLLPGRLLHQAVFGS